MQLNTLFHHQMLDQQCAIPPVVFVVTLVPVQLEYLNLIRSPLIEAMINIVCCFCGKNETRTNRWLADMILFSWLVSPR